MGFSLAREDLDHIGEEVHRQKYRFKMREGFSLEEIHLPQRILETSTPFGRLEESYIKSVAESFKKLLAIK